MASIGRRCFQQRLPSAPFAFVPHAGCSWPPGIRNQSSSGCATSGSPSGCWRGLPGRRIRMGIGSSFSTQPSGSGCARRRWSPSATPRSPTCSVRTNCTGPSTGSVPGCSSSERAARRWGAAGSGGPRWMAPRGGELPWAIGSEHWNRGLAAEAALAAIEWAGSLGLHEVVALIMAGNSRSRKVAEKAAIKSATMPTAILGSRAAVTPPRGLDRASAPVAVAGCPSAAARPARASPRRSSRRSQAAPQSGPAEHACCGG